MGFFFYCFQAVEDVNSLSDVVHLAVYLTRLAVMENPEIPHIVSPDCSLSHKVNVPRVNIFVLHTSLFLSCGLLQLTNA